MTQQQDPGRLCALQIHVFCPCLQGCAGLQSKLLQLVCLTSICQAALQHQGEDAGRARQHSNCLWACSHVMRNPANITRAAVICELFDTMLAPGSAAKETINSFVQPPCKMFGRPTPKSPDRQPQHAGGKPP